MSKHNVVELTGREKVRDELAELIRDGACKLVAQGLEVEVSELLSPLSGRRDAVDRAAVVRNGYQPVRDIQTGIGPVTVKVPKVRSRDGKPVSFCSALGRRMCARPRAWKRRCTRSGRRQPGKMPSGPSISL